jgi:uncharacterized membrane protein YukC
MRKNNLQNNSAFARKAIQHLIEHDQKMLQTCLNPHAILVWDPLLVPVRLGGFYDFKHFQTGRFLSRIFFD